MPLKEPPFMTVPVFPALTCQPVYKKERGYS
jgi:hypothetical protein